MRRLFWMGLGAAAAVVAAQRVQAAWRRYTPEGVAEQVEQAGHSALEATHAAVDRFRTAYAAREHDLLDQLLVQPENGDPAAVFGRRQPGASTGPGARPGPRGRVDDDEPLYDF